MQIKPDHKKAASRLLTHYMRIWKVYACLCAPEDINTLMEPLKNIIVVSNKVAF